MWCGSTPLSAEHVYPQWLQKFDGPSKYIAQDGQSKDSEPWLVTRRDASGCLIEYEDVRGRRTDHIHKVRVRQVCEDCNNGWMSQLESVQTLIQRLCLGPGEGLSKAESRTLATWAHKTFLMYDLWHAEPDRYYRTEDYQAFYTNREPCGDVRLYVAFSGSNSKAATFGMWHEAERLIPAGLDPHAYETEHGINYGSSYFAVDGVVIFEHWFAPDYPSTDPVGRAIKKASHRKMRTLGTQQIWPRRQACLRWPRRVLNHDETEAARLGLFDASHFLPVLAKRVPPPQ